MTPKLIAEYTELANKYLDQIPVENTSEFEVVAEALKAITDSNQPHTIPDSLKGRISDLKEIVDNPDLYVQYPKDYPEFKNIILTRVAAKINEFKQLTSQEKEKYIADQSKIKTETQQKHIEMAQHQPPAPTSDAHTITEEQMLLEQQGQFQTEVLNINQDRIAAIIARLHGMQGATGTNWSTPSYPQQFNDPEEPEVEIEREVQVEIEREVDQTFLEQQGQFQAEGLIDEGHLTYRIDIIFPQSIRRPSPASLSFQGARIMARQTIENPQIFHYPALDILHPSSRTQSNLYSENPGIHSSISTETEEEDDLEIVD